MNKETEKYLRSAIRDVADFPKTGIIFKDITTLVKDPWALNATIYEMKKYCHAKKIDKIVGIESRGFIFGSILAQELGIGFIPIRKRGKLPAEKMTLEYELEYGKDAIEVHKDAFTKGDNVLIVDDLLATGGTASAAAQLVENMGASVSGLLFLVELSFLKGKSKLSKYEVHSLLRYDAE